MIPYSLVVDVWEGHPTLDEAILLAGGVVGIVIRLNDMSGGHHIDTNFAKQWVESAQFIRTIYFVYNPWVSGLKNFEWLAAHCPNERVGKRIMIDVEVRKFGLSPIEYARQLEEFLLATSNVFIPVIYTGAWFLPIVSEWPKTLDYWWARYPGVWYPDRSEYRTWERINTDAANQLWTPGNAPGPITMWQVGGDRIKPPGADRRALDINLYPGTVEQLAAYFQSEVIPPPPPPLTDRQKIDILWREAGLAGWSLQP